LYLKSGNIFVQYGFLAFIELPPNRPSTHTISFLFGMFKGEGKYHLPFSDLGTMANFVYNLYLMMAERLTPHTQSQHFRKFESVTFDTESIPYWIVFHQEKLKEAKELVELWNLDYPLQLLTARRQNVQFGWTNKQEEMVLLSLSVFFIQEEWRYNSM
jgi:hypothetical protein